jgi:hypothetical protein
LDCPHLNPINLTFITQIRLPSWRDGSLAIVLGGGSIGGYLLGAFQPPPLVWAMVGLVSWYVIGWTTEAIALASLWLTGLLAIAVVQRPWPPAWAAISPWTNPQLWALLLLGIWGLALLLLISLALSAKQWHDRLSRDGQSGYRRRQTLSLTLLYWLALGCGAVMS